MSEKKANIRNSTAEFLIFTGRSGENSIEVRVAEGTVCYPKIGFRVAELQRGKSNGYGNRLSVFDRS